MKTTMSVASLCLAVIMSGCAKDAPTNFLQGQPAEDANTNCNDICSLTDSCKNELHAHGTYCKTWQSKPVCFGLYWKQDGKTACFQPNDPNCDESHPVSCDTTPPTITPNATTSVAPTKTTSGPTTTSVPTKTTSGPTKTTSGPTKSTAVPTKTTVGPTSVPTSAGPVGEYCATYDGAIKLGLDLNFKGGNVDIKLTGVISNHVEGIPFTYDSKSGVITISPNDRYKNFLHSLTIPLTPDQLTVTYNAGTKELVGSVMGVNMNGTTAQCQKLRRLSADGPSNRI